MSVRAAWLCLAVLMALAPAAGTGADYVRDEIRVKMRDGPGERYGSSRVLLSGDSVAPLAQEDGWIQVRTQEGQEGWVPSSYLTRSPPASVSLPRIEAKLAQTKARLEELEEKLGGQIEAVAELDTLRSRNLALESENIELTGADRWKTLGIGALILLAGFGVGASFARSGGRPRRLKL